MPLARGSFRYNPASSKSNETSAWIGLDRSQGLKVYKNEWPWCETPNSNLFKLPIRYPYGQADMSSCQQEDMTGGHVFLFSKKTCLVVETKTRLLVQQGDVSCCSTRRHVLLLSKKTCLLVEQEGMSSFGRRRHAFWFNKKTCVLVDKKTCPLVKNNISSC